MPPKPHLSQSQLETFAMCPERWRRRYIEGDVIPPGVAQLTGSSVHGAAEVNFRQKIASREDLPVPQMRELAAAAFESRLESESVTLAPEETSRGKRKVLGEAKDQTVAMAEFHAYQQAPSYQPLLVEERVRITLSGPRDLLAIVDLADECDRVIDFKTGKRRKSQEDADTSVQLSVYDVAFEAATGRRARGLVLDSIVAHSARYERDVVATTRSRDDRLALARRINAVGRAIDAGVFTPATPGAWWCSSRWCGYHATCPFVNGSRKQAD